MGTVSSSHLPSPICCCLRRYLFFNSPTLSLAAMAIVAVCEQVFIFHKHQNTETPKPQAETPPPQSESLLCQTAIAMGREAERG